jgi:hypothetical protein
MTIKVVLSPERMLEATKLKEIGGLLSGNLGTAIQLLPRFIAREDGSFVVEVVLDEDGDPIEFKNVEEASALVGEIGTKRLHSLAQKFMEVFKTALVNPPKGDG